MNYATVRRLLAATAITGLAALLHTSAIAFETLKYLGVAYLLYMAWMTLKEHGALKIETGTTPRAAADVIVSAILVNLLNPKLSIHGIVLTMYDSRNNLSNQVVADVREFMGPKVYDTVIPRNVRISEAPSYGKPVLVYDLKCVGSEAYLRLATEIIQREKALKAG